MYLHYSKYSFIRFIVDFFDFWFSEVYKGGSNRKLMASSNKICIRCGESVKENNPLNRVGAQYRDDQNEKTLSKRLWSKHLF